VQVGFEELAEHAMRTEVGSHALPSQHIELAEIYLGMVLA